MIILMWKHSKDIYSANSPEELVATMRRNSPSLPQPQQDSNAEYMKGVARRVEIYDGVQLIYSNEKSFLEALVQSDQITMMEVV